MRRPPNYAGSTMGQQVAVTRLPAGPGMVRFEANRNFTGMGHESFTSASQATGSKPAALVARRLLATGGVQGVHVYGNIISINLAPGADGSGLDDVVANMYQYWTPGREQPSFDEPAAEAAPSSGGSDAPAGGAASAYELRIPQLLRDRSAAALARWKANH